MQVIGALPRVMCGEASTHRLPVATPNIQQAYLYCSLLCSLDISMRSFMHDLMLMSPYLLTSALFDWT